MFGWLAVLQVFADLLAVGRWGFVVRFIELWRKRIEFNNPPVAPKDNWRVVLAGTVNDDSSRFFHRRVRLL